MAGILHFETFLLTGIMLNITPGNDTVFILARSIGQGKRAGVVSALGIGTGNMIHTVLAAFGLSIIIDQSVVLFNTIRFAGAAYLLYVGFRMLKDEKLVAENKSLEIASVSYGKIYRDGIVTNVLNPKVAMFFISFLPQFIDPEQQDAVWPFLALGGTFITTGTIWCLLLAVFADVILRKLKHNQKVSSYINKLCGMSLIALGLKLLF